MANNTMFVTDALIRDKYQSTIEKIRNYAHHYFWLAVLKDGRNIVQFKEDGTEVLFKEVMTELEKNNLAKFYWIPINQGKNSHGITIGEGERLIAIKRGYIRYKFSYIEERRMVYLLGVQKTINGENVKTILFIDQDGNTEISNNFEYDFI